MATTSSTPRAALRSGGAGWRRRRRRGPAGRPGRRPGRAPRRPGRRARGSARARARAGRSAAARSMMRASIGTPKASVLPEPVSARPHTSRPGSATGIAVGLDRERLGETGRGESDVDALGHAEVGETGRRLDGRQGGDRGEVGARRRWDRSPARSARRRGGARRGHEAVGHGGSIMIRQRSIRRLRAGELASRSATSLSR